MMKIKSRPLNKNEIFCCNKKDVKKWFNNESIDINFAYHQRHLDLSPNLYKGPIIKGKIVSWMSVAMPKQYYVGDYLSEFLPFLNFYVLKKDEYSKDLYMEYIDKILPKMFEKYKIHENDDPSYICGKYNFRVELFNNQFVLHEGIEN